MVKSKAAADDFEDGQRRRHEGDVERCGYVYGVS
jgi:hypothetical protein